MSAAHRALAQNLIAAVDAPLVAAVDIAPRPARFAAAPDRFRTGAAGTWLKAFLGEAEHPYLHQSMALGEWSAGRNVVLSTATASGKSLVFMAAAMAELLEGEGTILAFYPLKALSSDQRNAWERELARAGLPTALIGELTGDIPMAERERNLQRARVLLATPDAFHAWLMPMTGAPSAKRFLARLSLVIIDEAHSLDAVFGSHFALLFRRLRAACRRARR